MNDENEVPKIPMSIQQKIRDLEARKAELEMRLGALRRDYACERLNVDMGEAAARGRVAAINAQMISAQGELADTIAMLGAARPLAQAAREEARQVSVEEAWRAACEFSLEAEREAEQLTPQLRDCIRRLVRINTLRNQAFGAVRSLFGQDAQFELAPVALCADLIEELRAAANGVEDDPPLKQKVKGQNDRLMGQCPVNLDAPKRAA